MTDSSSSDIPKDPKQRSDLIAWLGRHELATYIALGIIAAGIWIFAEIADEVIEGETHTFDEKILLSMRNPWDSTDPRGPKWIEEMGRDFTALGGMGVLIVLTLAVCGGLLLQRKYHAMYLVFFAIVGGLILSLILKQQFERPRPDLVPHGSYVFTTSFPSGHSMLSAVTYLTLAALLARFNSRMTFKVYIMLVALFITLLVGVSRVYLGVHWPTDVLAGWAAGAAWATICSLTARYLQKRGQIE
jgi:undecaprenyl-diphosphatase